MIELPPYVRAHESPVTGAVTFTWETNSKIRKEGFKPAQLALGDDRVVAFQKVERELLPALYNWRETRRGLIVIDDGVQPNSIDALFDRWRGDPTFTALSARTREFYNRHLKNAAAHTFRKGLHENKRFGELQIKTINVEVARILIDEYARYTKEDPETHTMIVITREAAAHHMMSTISTCWNAMHGVVDDVPFENPFSRVRRMRPKRKKTYAATIENLAVFDYRAPEFGFPNMGTLCLTAFEIEMRVESIATRFDCSHYKPADRPNEMLVTHWKTGESRWVHLKDSDGLPLYAALESRLDALKAGRTSGILIPRDGTADKPWARPGKALGKEFYSTFRAIADKAGLPKVCQYTSFRHGGITEGAEAGLTEDELMTLSGHKDPRTIRNYITQTRALFENAQRKRLQHRSRVIEGLRRSGALDHIDDAEVFEILAKLPAVPKSAEDDTAE
jgi:integrase